MGKYRTRPHSLTVEDKNGRVLDDGPCEGDPLLLATTQSQPALAWGRVGWARE